MAVAIATELELTVSSKQTTPTSSIDCDTKLKSQFLFGEFTEGAGGILLGAIAGEWGYWCYHWIHWRYTGNPPRPPYTCITHFTSIGSNNTCHRVPRTLQIHSSA